MLDPSRSFRRLIRSIVSYMEYYGMDKGPLLP